MPIDFRQHTLANGLTIIAEIDPNAYTSAAGFFVRTGARDEAPPLMGVSHFLEHMMFKGTVDLSAEAINQGFDDLGASNNAFTSNEITCFYAHTLPEYAGSTLDLLGRMMRPALRQGDFDTEKGVILEEIAMYKDNPFWVLYEETVDRFYAPHPLRHRVLGTADTITELARDSMQGYFDTRYSADNTVVALAGQVEFDAVVAQLDALCGSWQRTRATRDAHRRGLRPPRCPDQPRVPAGPRRRPRWQRPPPLRRHARQPGARRPGQLPPALGRPRDRHRRRGPGGLRRARGRGRVLRLRQLRS